MTTYPAPTGWSSEPGYCWYCDCDIDCPDHPSTSCGACENACHCIRHGYIANSGMDCDETCRTPEWWAIVRSRMG